MSPLSTSLLVLGGMVVVGYSHLRAYKAGLFDAAAEEYPRGFDDGADWGYAQGSEEGHYAGLKAGFEQASGDTLQDCYEEEYAEGYSDGFVDGFNNGLGTSLEPALDEVDALLAEAEFDTLMNEAFEALLGLFDRHEGPLE